MSGREEVLLARLREATVALRDTLDERDALLRERCEPIAIVGMGCRFPGGADDPRRFWELLIHGRDGVGALARRWAEVGERADAGAPRWAGLLTGPVDEFDPGFFGISPREAQSLDPQQRLLLEVGWEALEDAGIPPHVLKDSRTGVYVGATNTDYAGMLAAAPGADQDAYAITGNLLSVAAGRLAYTWGLRGPCMTIDTVCSSSLVTVHLACQSLRVGESDLALAGGVNLILSAATMAGVMRTQALAPDGRCKTFDALANGFARGEGCGVVVLKRLRDAVRDGDRVWATIRGSAINQDGASTGLTAPNVQAQIAMLRDALANARVAPEEVGFVETHGTGTSLGDPIEVEALREVLGAVRADGSRCVLGAVKTNVGHLEAAAGVAGLIKAALVLRFGEIPRNLNFRAINPRVRIEGTGLALATETIAWPRGERRRIAGVSAFGMSGTNAHVILEEAPEERPGRVRIDGAAAARDGAAGAAAAARDGGRARDGAAGAAAAARDGGRASDGGDEAVGSDAVAELVVVSGKTAGALAAVCGRLIGAAPEAGLRELARSLATTRSPLEHRATVVARSREALAAGLAGLARGETPPGTSRGVVPRTRGGLAFLFTGQGAQVVGMGRGLHAAWPAFRAAFDECAGLFDAVLPRRLTEVMWGDEAGLIDRTEFTQPALFCLQVGLVGLWRSWGVEPGLLAGHSIGELTAAWTAGVFNLADAVRLVAARGRLMGALPAGGAMVMIAADEATVAGAIAGEASVAIAAINGPTHVVIAGAEAPVLAIAAGFAGRGVKTRRLTVSHAFHSPLVEPMLAEFAAVAATVGYSAPRRALVGNVSGGPVGAEVAAPGYWVRHARAAVRFADGVRALWGAGARTFVEVGPRPALLASVPECVGGEPKLVASLRGGRDERESVLAALGAVWLDGVEVDWRGVFAGEGRRVELPGYPWQRQRCWFVGRDAAEDRGATRSVDRGGLAGGVTTDHGGIDGGATRSAERGGVAGGATADRGGARAPAEVGAYYDELAQGDALADGRGEIDGGERYLTFAPFAAPVPGFSWLLATVDPQGHPEQARRVVAAQREMRAVLFREVEFAGCRRALDFGCGYGTDLVVLAGRHPHLELHGHTVSAEQVSIATGRAERAGVAERVRVVRRDSAAGPWDADYDLVFGVEVACHVRDKAALFANAGAHLRAGGWLVLSDFVAELGADIEHAEAGSFLATADRWAEVLGRAGLRLTSVVDVSPEIANFLEDPAFADNLARLRGAGAGVVDAALHSYDRLGELLRRRMASYVLMTARKASEGTSAALVADNRRALARRTAYAAARGGDAGDDRFIEVVWAPAEPPAGRGGARRWVVVGGGEVGAQVRARLVGLGHAVAEDPARGFAGLGPTDVVHLGSLEVAAAPGLAALEAALVRGADDVLATVRALTTGRWRDAPRLWLVTRGAQATGGEDVDPHQAPVIGLGRVIALEHPELRCARVDLGLAGDEDEAAALVRELLADDAEDEVALRAGRRAVARLVRRGSGVSAGTGERSATSGAGAGMSAGTGERSATSGAGAGMSVGTGGGSLGTGGVSAMSGAGAGMSVGTGVHIVEAGGGEGMLGVSAGTGGRTGRMARDGGGGEAAGAGGRTVRMGAGGASARALDGAGAGRPGVSAGTGEGAGRTDDLSVGSGARAVTMGEIGAGVGMLGVSPGTGAGEAAYLVTGGLGGLGLAVAGWLAGRGARRLVLMGRQGAASEQQRAAVAALVDRGVRVTVARADVGERADVERVLAEIRASGARLRGVVHAAGGADPAMLVDVTPARLRGGLAAKARGALLLHALTREEELEFFVMFASVAGLLGLAGTGGYAAANAVLDALAHHRRARGLAGLSVDWGVFTGVGLATRAGERAAAAYTAGMRGMTAEEGLAALGRLLAGDAAQVGVVPFDAAQWVESYPAAAGSRRLAPLLAVDGTHVRAGGELRARVEGASAGARAGTLLAGVRGHAAEVLRIPAEEFDVAAPLTELGMDSLMGLELRNRIAEALALEVPATLLWTYPTVAELSAHLLTLLGGVAEVDDAAALIDEEFEALS